MTNFSLAIGGFDNLWVLLNRGVLFENMVDELLHHFDFYNYEVVNAEFNPIEGSWLILVNIAFPAHICDFVEKDARANGAEIFKLAARN